MDQIVGLKSSSHAELPPPPKIFAEGRRPFQWNLCLGLRYKQLSFQSSRKMCFFSFASGCSQIFFQLLLVRQLLYCDESLNRVPFTISYIFHAVPTRPTRRKRENHVWHERRALDFRKSVEVIRRRRDAILTGIALVLLGNVGLRSHGHLRFPALLCQVIQYRHRFIVRVRMWWY